MVTFRHGESFESEPNECIGNNGYQPPICWAKFNLSKDNSAPPRPWLCSKPMHLCHTIITRFRPNTSAVCGVSVLLFIIFQIQISIDTCRAYKTTLLPDILTFVCITVQQRVALPLSSFYGAICRRLSDNTWHMCREVFHNQHLRCYVQILPKWCKKIEIIDYGVWFMRFEVNFKVKTIVTTRLK